MAIPASKYNVAHLSSLSIGLLGGRAMVPTLLSPTNHGNCLCRAGYIPSKSSGIPRGFASGEIQPLCKARVTAWALSLAFSLRRIALT